MIRRARDCGRGTRRRAGRVDASRAMTGENRCFRGCCVGTSDVRLDHVVRQASASVDARARWRPADESAVILRGDVLRAGPLSTVYYGRFGKRAIAIKRPKLRTTREIDRYHAELGLMLELAHEHVVAVVGARAAPPRRRRSAGPRPPIAPAPPGAHSSSSALRRSPRSSPPRAACSPPPSRTRPSSSS